MSAPHIHEQYRSGSDLLNFVVYRSTAFAGDDEVLQHKAQHGVTEMAHITLHPDGTVNVHKTRNDAPIKQFVNSGLSGFTPAPSKRLQAFLTQVRPKI